MVLEGWEWSERFSVSYYHVINNNTQSRILHYASCWIWFAFCYCLFPKEHHSSTSVSSRFIFSQKHNSSFSNTQHPKDRNKISTVLLHVTSLKAFYQLTCNSDLSLTMNNVNKISVIYLLDKTFKIFIKL